VDGTATAKAIKNRKAILQSSIASLLLISFVLVELVEGGRIGAPKIPDKGIRQIFPIREHKHGKKN
jgi:hypothetical protein